MLPLLFGGGASTIIIEMLLHDGGDPLLLSDCGANPPYERMRGTAVLCFMHTLVQDAVLLILGDKANNTRIDVTFAAISDALAEYAPLRTSRVLPVVVSRGWPGLVAGLLTLQRTLDAFDWRMSCLARTPLSPCGALRRQTLPASFCSPATHRTPPCAHARWMIFSLDPTAPPLRM